MNKYYISIPFSIDLCSEQNWISMDDKSTEFYVIRLHFLIRERQHDSRTKLGEVLGVHEAASGIELKKVISIEQERSISYSMKSLRTSLVQNRSVQEFAYSIASELKVRPLLSLSQDVTSKLASEFTSSFQDSFSYDRSDEIRRKVKFELTYTILPEASEKFVSVIPYKKYALDLYLAYVDYLQVTYQKSILGLRKKRNKYPPATSSADTHPNIVKIGLPLASIHYWKMLPKSAVMIPEDHYRNEVDDPDEIILQPIDTRRTIYLPKPKVPTLYQLSNVAFPLKWIKREGDWTEEDLLKLEWEEADGSAWWFQYGPGRK